MKNYLCFSGNEIKIYSYIFNICFWYMIYVNVCLCVYNGKGNKTKKTVTTVIQCQNIIRCTNFLRIIIIKRAKMKDMLILWRIMWITFYYLITLQIEAWRDCLYYITLYNIALCHLYFYYFELWLLIILLIG